MCIKYGLIVYYAHSIGHRHEVRTRQKCAGHSSSFCVHDPRSAAVH